MTGPSGRKVLKVLFKDNCFLDVEHIEKMCQELSEESELAFVVVTGNFAQGLPNDEDGVSNAGSNPPLRPAQVRFLVFTVLLFRHQNSWMP